MTKSEVFMRRIRLSKVLQVFVVVSFFFIASYLAWNTVFYSGPDERLRYLVPKYIFEHGRLPLGTDSSTITSGNWSYAFYPQWLGPLLSAFLMKVTSIFTSSNHAITFSARLVSVLCGTFAIWLIGRITKQITKSEFASTIIMTLVAFTPQVVYLSSYVNNDIISLVGVAVTAFGMQMILNNGWQMISTLIFGAGIVVISLSYMNAYGFIISAGLFMILTSFRWIKSGVMTPKTLAKAIGLLGLIGGIFVAPFFVRNYVLYHDLLGMSTFHQRYLLWLRDGGKVLQIPYKGTLWQFLTDSNHYYLMKISSIGRFSYFTVMLSDKMYRFYSVVPLALGGLFLILGLGKIAYLIPHRNTNTRQITDNLLLLISILVGGFITIGVHIYYCLEIDYQPQGRYLVTLIVPLVFLFSLGIKWMSTIFEKQELESPVLRTVLRAVIILLTLTIVFSYGVATQHVIQIYLTRLF